MKKVIRKWTFDRKFCNQFWGKPKFFYNLFKWNFIYESGKKNKNTFSDSEHLKTDISFVNMISIAGHDRS